MNDYVLPVERYGGYESAIDWWTLYPILILIAVLVVFAITVLVVVHIVRKQRKERQRMEHRYREARALAKGIINAHLDYNNTMHAVDDATIEASNHSDAKSSIASDSTDPPVQVLQRNHVRGP